VSAFDDAFTALIGNEGGYSNNSADPGGETMWGITARVARKHGYAGAMRDLPLQTAKTIAKAEYWDAVRGDELSPALAFQLFDTCYNSGAGEAVMLLQRSLGVTADGSFGPATMSAVKASPDEYKLIGRLDAYRLLFMADLAEWPTFGKGWARRIANNLLRAMA
jgi:lysozyme family protein